MARDNSQQQGGTEKKPGIIRRLFSLLGRIGRFVRSAINLLFLLLFLIIIGSLFTSNINY